MVSLDFSEDKNKIFQMNVNARI